MRLWNEYEGTTIASTFPIEKLIRPEGRSAFFSTVNGSGQPAVIRLIEAHFDEAEILARWRMVASLDQPHLLKIKKFGHTELDGEPLLYIVIEPSDADLAGILRERPLTLDETQQIATSLVPALQALHRANLIHEHVEPSNILAIGEEIKLRSDCIREIPEDPEGTALQARDVHDLATVLLQCLTQQRTLEAHRLTPLPKPFDQIVRNGIAGTWGLDQIAQTLAIRPQTKLPASQPAPAPASAPRQPETPSRATLAPQPSSAPQSIPTPDASRTYLASSRRTPLPVETDPRRKRIIGLSALGILLLIFIVWHATHSSPKQPITTLAQMPAQPAASSVPAETPAAPGARPAPTQPLPVGTGDWRVIAFTYNHREQAQQKADTLSHQHPSLNPQVFTPTGRAPFLVAVGGLMSRNQAFVFRSKARSLGLPRDTYARNYSSHRRR